MAADTIEIIATDENFDEKAYLLANPDVAVAVQNGRIKSGRMHFETSGRHEFRMLRVPVTKKSLFVQRIISGARKLLRIRISLPRHEYKDVWNAISRTEDDAKIAVCGYTDEKIFSRTAEATVRTLDKCVGVHPSDVILEIGAGVGRVGPALAPRCKEWIGADVSPRMVRHIQTRLAEFPNVRAVELSGFDLSPIADKSIDLVYCTVVFMHLDEWDRYNYVLEGMRVLKPGGRMIVDNVNLLSEKGWRMFEYLRALPPHSRPSNISKSSTPQELVEYFRRAGFTAIEQQTEDLWITVWGRKP